MELVANLALLREAEAALQSVAERHGLEVACQWDEELDHWKVRFWRSRTRSVGESAVR